MVMQRIANPCTPVRFRYPPPQYLVKIPILLYPKQHVVLDFLYTIRTQNFGVDLTNPLLMFEQYKQETFAHELWSKFHTNPQEIETG